MEKLSFQLRAHDAEFKVHPHSPLSGSLSSAQSVYLLFVFNPTFCILICNSKNQKGGRDGFINSQDSHDYLSTESQKSSCSSIEISMETKSGHDKAKTYSTLTKQSPRKNTVQLLGQSHARC
jgi:hypothetical protein